jgi:hypothetical protein
MACSIRSKYSSLVFFKKVNKKTKRRRILFIISKDEYVRNYIRTGITKQLSEHCDLSILAIDSLELIAELAESLSFSGTFCSSKDIEEAHYRYLNILMYHYRKRSKTFPFRLKRDTGLPLPEESNRAIKTATQFIKRGKRGAKTRDCLINGNPWRFKSFKKKFEASLPINPSLENAIEKAKPDLVLFPSSAYDPTGNDVARIAKKMEIPSVFLIDNWDNLSSKSIFWTPPNYLGVWSEQHVEHAERIHKIPKENVFPIGTPRFDHYFAARGKTAQSHFDFPYVLFSGCCLPFDETATLQVLDNELSKNPEIYGNLKIVYRPHPWRQKRKRELLFREQDFNCIILDPQIKEQYLNNRDTMANAVAFQPDTDYYPPLIDHALFVTGPLTTFLIEALIFHKPYLGLAYDDGVHLTSPSNAFKYYEMYEGIDLHPGVTLVHHFNHIVESFRKAYQQSAQKKELQTNWDSHLNHFLRIDETPYNERLLEMLAVINEEER